LQLSGLFWFEAIKGSVKMLSKTLGRVLVEVEVTGMGSGEEEALWKVGELSRALPFCVLVQQ
jgi:hypothetical protein